MFRLFVVGSLGLNFVLLLALAGSASADDYRSLDEHALYGPQNGRDKVAVVRVSGVIVEGMLGFAHKQIEKAARDDRVKAVVLRVESPGGTVTASDDLHRRLVELRDGSSPRFKSSPKPIVVSMGALAASGGYYIAAPAKKIVAEPTTITGSIGVYASFPNLKGFGDKYGVKWPLIKAGAIKGSGGLFSDMTPQERQPWQDMVNNAYGRFKEVVEEGRPDLKGKMEEPLFPPRDVPEYTDKGEVDREKPPVKYTRYRADGGIFTAQDAQKYGLVDEVGPLEKAVDLARGLAGTPDARVVRYEHPKTLADLLTGGDLAGRASAGPDLRRLAAVGIPRLWYLEPQSELAGLLAATGAGE